jgi:signal transduction histidine kinase
MKISIRTRMTIWYCLVFLLSICLLEAVVYVSLAATMTRTVDKELSTRMNGLADFLKEHLGRLPLTRVLADLQIHVALQPSLVILQNAQGQTLYCGTLVQALCGAPVRSGTEAVSGATYLRMHTGKYEIQATQYTLLVATDLYFQRELLSRFRKLMLLIIPAAMLCAAVGGYWLSGRAFAPVFGIISSVKAINDRSLSLRLHVPTTGDEIQLLSETLNGMLARVETSFRQVTELTANASHELRTPVAIIRAASEVALLDPRPTVASHRGTLIQIKDEAERTTLLLESLLMLARSDAGVQSLNVRAINLYDSVAKAANACQCLSDAKGVRLSLIPSPRRMQVWADAANLHRLWVLLIDNAIKYTPAGGTVTLALNLTPTSQPVCEITDTGIGIAFADLPRIYDRFFRAQNARQQSDGSGLGLTMVKWIAEAHGAELAVTSELGRGSKVRVTFPVEYQAVSNKTVRITDDLVASKA